MKWTKSILNNEEDYLLAKEGWVARCVNPWKKCPKVVSENAFYSMGTMSAECVWAIVGAQCHLYNLVFRPNWTVEHLDESDSSWIGRNSLEPTTWERHTRFPIRREYIPSWVNAHTKKKPSKELLSRVHFHSQIPSKENVLYIPFPINIPLYFARNTD